MYEVYALRHMLIVVDELQFLFYLLFFFIICCERVPEWTHTHNDVKVREMWIAGKKGGMMEIKWDVIVPLAISDCSYHSLTEMTWVDIIHVIYSTDR